MTFETLAKLTAAELSDSMMVGGFKTLSEMCKSYWWGTNELKKELMVLLKLSPGRMVAQLNFILGKPL